MLAVWTMAAPNYEQIQSFNNVAQQLMQLATDEFMKAYRVGMSIDEVVDIAAQVAEQYNVLAYELGAQWYDLCTQLANIDADPAELPESDPDLIRQRARDSLENMPADSNMKAALNYYLQNEIEKSIRATGTANLWRDYERGLCDGRWARVPVGDTCAWCLMLASQGAWYLSKESALGANGGHYHDGCNCVAVYHSDAENIPNYDKLTQYKSMYYEADNMRRSNASGREPYDDELKMRIAKAKAEHEAREAERAERGEKPARPWTVYNEDLILMREIYGLK